MRCCRYCLVPPEQCKGCQKPSHENCKATNDQCYAHGCPDYKESFEYRNRLNHQFEKRSSSVKMPGYV